MEIKPVHILRLFMQDSDILMQLTNLYINSKSIVQLGDQDPKDIEESIKNLCQRVDWMAAYLRKHDGFTYNEITTTPDQIPAVIALTETLSAATKEALKLQ